MKAIAGLVSNSPFLAAPRAAEQMLRAIDAPPGGDIYAWQEGRVALGARSGSSGGSSRHVDDRFVVVSDARLDNREELCSLLSLSRSTGEASLIAAAYKEWGSASPQKLIGDFAFAVWDRAANALFCARDRFGVKPFYYRALKQGFRFASTMGALAADTGLAQLEINDPWIVDFSAGLITDLASTPYADIRRLPPAHSLYLGREGVSVESYWSFASIGPVSDTLQIEELRDALGEAVRARLPERRAAAFLSGGLDSSSICCLARNALVSQARPDLTAVSIVFDDTPQESERSFIETVLADGHITPLFVSVPHYRPMSALPRMLAAQDGPFLGPGLPLMDHAYQAVAAGGFDSVLDGHGGDEVISHGTGWLHELARAGKWGQLRKEIAALASRQGGNAFSIAASYFAYHGRGPFARASRRIIRFARKRREDHSAPELLASRWRDDAAHKRHAPFFRSDAQYFKTERAHQEWVLSSPQQAYALETLSHISRSHGLESRVPFWDQRVVELCLRFPGTAKLSGGHTRALIRSAMKGILPERIRQRSDKLEFSTHFVRGLRLDLDTLRALGASGNSDLERFISREAFLELIAALDHPDGPVRANAAALVWRGAMLGVWFAARRSAGARPNAPLEREN
ncbi:MAG: asparagine synthase-related protein [Hyphomonadaceae bacterium]